MVKQAFEDAIAFIVIAIGAMIPLVAAAIFVYGLIAIVSPQKACAEYLGRIGSNPFCSDCTANPFAPIVNPFVGNSLTNRFGPNGNPFGAHSPRNPFALDTPRVYDNGSVYSGGEMSTDELANEYGVQFDEYGQQVDGYADDIPVAAEDGAE